MARIIAVANQKGGVGKTTTAISLGAGLSQLGSRVLLVDMDPQGTLSLALGMNVGAMEETVYDVLRDVELAMEQVVVPTAIGCDLAPSDINLVGAEVELIAEPGREYILKSKLSPLEEKYDYIFIDCPPSLGLLTLNALTAAREILIPVQSHYLALRGMELLLQTIAKVRARLNPEIEILGILPTFYDRRTRHAQEVVAELEHRYGDHLIKVNIPSTIKFADATTAGESILSFSSSSPAAMAYGQLVREVHNAKTS